MQCNGVFNKRPRGTSLTFEVSIVLLCMCARIPCVVGQNKGFYSCLHVVSVFLSIHVQIYAFLRGSSLSVAPPPPLFALFYQCVSGACSSPPPHLVMQGVLGCVVIVCQVLEQSTCMSRNGCKCVQSVFEINLPNHCLHRCSFKVKITPFKWSQMRACGKWSEKYGTLWLSNRCCYQKGTFHFTIYNVMFGKSKMADVDTFAL